MQTRGLHVNKLLFIFLLLTCLLLLGVSYKNSKRQRENYFSSPTIEYFDGGDRSQEEITDQWWEESQKQEDSKSRGQLKLKHASPARNPRA